MDKMIEKTMKNLEKNNMQPFFVESAKDVVPLVKTLIHPGESVANGGSETLLQTGVMELLDSGDYQFIDRRKATPDTIRDCYVQAFGCDSYFCSSNAITENGELYNVDGNSNRVACIVYGPKQVIIVAGRNKIVPDLDAAIERVKTVAAPLNTKRLHCATYCEKENKCVSLLNEAPQLCEGCTSDGRICCNYVVSARQRHKNRIKVILVNENLGY